MSPFIPKAQVAARIMSHSVLAEAWNSSVANRPPAKMETSWSFPTLSEFAHIQTVPVDVRSGFRSFELNQISERT
jgi:hypothetical protein